MRGAASDGWRESVSLQPAAAKPCSPESVDVPSGNGWPIDDPA
jgi:hypothetical protein